MDMQDTLHGGVFIFLQVACRTAVLAAGVLLIQRLPRKWLGSSLLHLLWLVVAVRLLLPWAPASSYSVFNLSPWGSSRQEARFSWTVQPAASDALAPVVAPTNMLDHAAAASALADQTASFQSTLQSTLSNLLPAFLFGAWLLGAAYFLARTCYASWRLCRRVRPLKETQDARLLRILNACRREMNVRQRVALLVNDATGQPALMGLWRARILLPTSIAHTFSDDALRMVFLHELAHFRRGDIAINWLLAGVRALQWCNPVFWLTSRQIAKHREAACDADVLRVVGRDHFKQYGETVLRVVQHAMQLEASSAAAPACVAGMVCFLGRRTVLQERISMLHRHSCHSSFARRAVGYLLVATAAMVGLTAAASQAQQPPKQPAAAPAIPPVAHELQTYLFQSGASRKKQEPLIVISYDVKKVLEASMAKHGLSRKAAEFSLLQIVTSFRYPRAFDLASGRVTNLDGNDAEKTNDAAKNKPSAAYYGDKLIISETEREHKRIAQQLEVLRKFGDKQITVEVRFLTVSNAFFDQLGPDLLKEAESAGAQVNLNIETIFNQPESSKSPFQAATTTTVYSPAAAIMLSEKSIFHLMQVAQADDRSNIMSAPKVTLFNGQTAEISDSVQRPFVVDVVPVTVEHVTAHQPVIQVLEEGTATHLRTVANHENVVQIDCRIAHTTISNVETVRLARLGVQRGVSIQRPHLHTTSVQFTTKLKPGHSLVISGIPLKSTPPRKPNGKPYFWSKPKPKPEPRSMLILITPRVLEEPADSKPVATQRRRHAIMRNEKMREARSRHKRNAGLSPDSAASK